MREKFADFVVKCITLFELRTLTADLIISARHLLKEQLHNIHYFSLLFGTLYLVMYTLSAYACVSLCTDVIFATQNIRIFSA